MAYGLVYERVFNWDISRAGDNYELQVAELRPGIFHEGWIACLTELSISADHLAWAKVVPKFELPNLLDPYSALILSGFNEEEYMNQPAKEDEVIAPEIDPIGDGNGSKMWQLSRLIGMVAGSLREGLKMPI
ncbi:hypothetical protein Acr_18g0008130 [Actinidia rufa]|uniref:Uncharacterized protein n=1 Tax=Actinidia rufa TaxID=165716 RepID=A0A7J0G781_9ERIC|nr:hypothetical protein Acr_18g0008130 [Actinidia rufa]